MNARAQLAGTPEIANRIETGAYDTNYHDSGKGPAVLLIHGSGPGVTAWANWRLTLPALTAHGRVVAPDLVGFGYTESPPNVIYDASTWVKQLTDLLDALGIEIASIVGNSFGGSMALAFAQAHPSRVDKLVLMGAVGVSFPITSGLEKVWGYQPSVAAMKDLLQVFVYNQAMATDELAEMRYRASVRADVQERFANLFPAPRQRWVDALAQNEASLRKIAHETLIVHGRDDQVIPFSASERLATLMPNARLAPFDQCGHWVQIEHPERFNNLVVDFLFGAADGSPGQSRQDLAGALP
jgi:2-hydroxymuconate-semialdehyde hydrolase